MNNSNDSTAMPANDAVEALLSQARPRTAPPGSVEHEVREAVHAEWQAAVGARRRKRRLVGFATAATVMVAAALTFISFRDAPVTTIDVASVVRTQGAVAVTASADRRQQVSPLMQLKSGQTLITANDAGAGLAWAAGGSLRVDRNSRVELLSATKIALHAGRVYFDSHGLADTARLTIQTPHGAVTHDGTQFMTATTRSGLVVSVREGAVSVAGKFHDRRAVAGQVVEMTGSAPARVRATTGTDGEWAWTEELAPPVDLQGRSTHDFLAWVSRETGYELRYASGDAEQLARSAQFRGNLQGQPRSDLRLWMMTIDLEAQFDPDTGALMVSRSR